MTAAELLVAVRKAQGIPSNYRLARLLDVPDHTVQRWNTGRNTPDDATAARLAAMAGLDPDAVVAAMHSQRAHEPTERERWARIASRLSTTAAGVLCAVLSLWTSQPMAGPAPRGLDQSGLCKTQLTDVYIVLCSMLWPYSRKGRRFSPAT